jgi:thioredoxin reductase (NADPH)
MDSLLTTIGFFALTGLFVWLHLRKGTPDARPMSPPVQGASGPPCVRCGAPVPAGSGYCPGCGMALQVYEIVAAPIATGTTASGALRALVRGDMCVGCGTCVASCPEPGAITMRGKLAVVDDALCQGHGECVAACPVGAISVNAGTAANRVMVPQLDGAFQSNVQGLFIVGELGGRGLIKNAINEGKIAVEHVARELPPGEPRADGRDDVLDVAIVGSGPAGLSAGLEALRQGLSYAVIEQGSLSDTVRKYPRHKLLLAEPVKIPLYGDLWVADASKETLLQVWETIVANTGLQVDTGHKVEHVLRDGDHFIVQTAQRFWRARRVVLALGRRGSPRRLGVPGEDLGKVFYDIVEMEAFAGRRVLVVGGGDSAIESALGLVNQAGTQVTLSYRGTAFDRIKARNREKLDAAVSRQKITLLLGSQVREIREDRVVLDVSGTSTILPSDNVIVRIGGEAPFAFLEKLGVRIVQKDVPVTPARAG